MGRPECLYGTQKAYNARKVTVPQVFRVKQVLCDYECSDSGLGVASIKHGIRRSGRGKTVK